MPELHPPFPIRGDHLSAHDRRRFRLGIEHLYDLGPRAVGEFVWEAALVRARPGTVLGMLDLWSRILGPLVIEVSGGRDLPPPAYCVHDAEAPEEAEAAP